MNDLLDGVRVLDLTTILAGPFAAYQLSLMGADVIKLEIPDGGDPARDLGSENPQHIPSMGPSFVAQNAGKRSIAVDLKTPGGREIFTRLIQESDVLLENMRPGVLGRLGFPPERIREINPHLVYCAVSGFGQTGPIASRPAYDQIIQGLAGMIDVTGFPETDPVRAGFPIADTLGGFAAAMAICAALARRGEERAGCFLDVSMLETALTAMGWAVSDYLVGGRPSRRRGNHNVTSSPSGTFRTGRGQLNIAANSQAQFEVLCRVCACEHLITDSRFSTRGDRKKNREALTLELEESLAARTAIEWEHLLSEAGVPAGRVLTVEESLAQPQVVARGLVHEMELPASGGRMVSLVGSGIHVDGTTLSPSSPPPLLGEHTDEILTELGYSPEQVAALRAERVLSPAIRKVSHVF
ncbi:CoA transferase [Diaminobutyricibacter tongyongensis]|uniref:CoA transferase n=1 Tax=Leifsonia tongyongensis TaxID=1268043 RepID=A0A6L9XUL6_9MICO|nr:CoA transferase [Diaminobutyricibacter tongyongensis]NEN04708.1 CoA transferase [Diaminobutyricibacter tongyongensis]